MYYTKSLYSQNFFNFSWFSVIDKTVFILCVFDVRHHQDFSSAQPIKVGFDFRQLLKWQQNLLDTLFYVYWNKNILW